MSFSWKPRYNSLGSKIVSEKPGQWQNQFITETAEIYQNGHALIVDGVAIPNTLGYNQVAAGSNRWAGFIQTAAPWIDTSWGQRYEGAGDPAISPNGVFFAYTFPFQSNDKELILEFVVNDKLIKSVIDKGAITDVRLSNQGIVYTRSGEVWGHWFGQQPTQKIQVAAQEYRPIPIDTPQGLWVLSQAYGGFILRLFGTSIGYKFENDGQTFYPDAVFDGLTGIKVAYTDQNGFGTDRIFNLTDKRIDLRSSSSIPANVPPINKKCWVGWFEFNQPPSVLPPGNCLVAIRYNDSGSIKDYSGRQIAVWCDGISVEDVENKCASTFYPCVAYWDTRKWPEINGETHYPTLKPQDYLSIQAYCRVDENAVIFENSMRTTIEKVPDTYPKIALVCQCYTSNDSLTNNLSSLVPVFARLARDYPRVTMLLMFTDQGRATGLNDHQELLPLYQQLFSGVTGIPSEIPSGEPIMDGLTNEQWDTLVRVHAKTASVVGDGVWTPEQIGSVLNETAYLHRNDRQPLGLQSKPGGMVAFMPDGTPVWNGLRLIYNGKHYGGDVCGACSVGKFVPVRADFSGENIPPNSFIDPIPPANSVPNPNPDPNPNPNPPVLGTIGILDYDNVVKRSDPNGMLIRFDVHSEKPVILIELDLEGDGEPSLILEFLDEPRRDGRYCRALAFKPTVNGTWTLRVVARDNEGGAYQSDGSHRVVVVE